MNLLVFAKAPAWLQETWMAIWLSLNDTIYSIIKALYKVFEIVSKTNLFSDQDFSTITKSVYRIMGIATIKTC